MTALGILLLILKIIGIILLCVLGLIILLCFVPVGVTAEYSETGAEVIARAGPVRIRVFPRPKKQASLKDQEKRKKKEQEKQNKKAEKEKQKGENQDRPKRKIGGMLPLFKELLGIAVDLLSHFRRKLKIRELTLYLTLGGGGDDPAKSASLYGMAWAAIGNLWTVLERVFIIKDRDVQAGIDFFTEENRIYARATATIFVGAVLQMALIYGLRALQSYLKFKKQTKNAARLQEKGGI